MTDDAEPRLIAKTGPLLGQRWTVPAEGLLVGRAQECEIAVTDPLVSRMHCRIWADGDEHRIADLQSKNGIYLNDKPVEEETVGLGDEIRVGGSVFVLTVEPDERLAGACADEVETYSEAKTLYFSLSDLTEGGEFTTPPEFSAPERTGPSSADNPTDAVIAFMESVATLFRPHGLKYVSAEPDLVDAKRVAVSFTALDAGRALAEVAAKALETRKPLLFPLLATNHGGVTLSSAMACPLLDGDTVLGAVAVSVEQADRELTREDLRYLAHLAARAAERLAAFRGPEDSAALSAEKHDEVAGTLVGDSYPMQRLRAMIDALAASRVNVLITGETGTGKALVARALHDASDRCEKVFVSVNCAAIPDDLFVSEILGHEKGAFTGAEYTRMGLMEQANGGTLFLDEVGELAPYNQARLLNAVETNVIRRVGGERDIPIGFRLVSATNRDLAEAMQRGGFRQDLFYRLNVAHIDVPPLRDRPEDIPLLADHFLAKWAAEHGTPRQHLDSAAVEHLQAHRWPGNVRELKNCIDATAALIQEPRIGAGDLLIREFTHNGEAPQAMADVEKHHLREALEQCGWNVAEAAKLLRIGRSTLYKKIRDYGLRG